MARDVRDLHEPGEFEAAYIVLVIKAMLLFMCCVGSGSSRRSMGSRPVDEITEVDTPIPTPPRSLRVVGHDVSDAETDEEVDPRLQALEADPRKILDSLERLSARVDHPLRVSFSDQAPLSEWAEDPTLISGADRLIASLNATDQVFSGAAPDSAAATTGSPVASASAVSPPGTPASRVSREIEKLENEARNPRETALDHLRRYQEMTAFKIGGDAKVRVVPSFIAKLYRTGRTAVREMEEFARSKGLEKCHTAAELPTLALIADRLLGGSSEMEVINMPAVEAICSRMYGLTRALEDVHCEADWLKPQSFPGKWRSKIKWALLDEYGVMALDSHEYAVPEADEEVSRRRTLRPRRAPSPNRG